MMTILTSRPYSTSCDSMRVSVSSNVTVKMKPPHPSAAFTLRSGSLSKSLSITRAAWMKDDD